MNEALKYQTPVGYEKRGVILQKQTKPIVTESLDAKQFERGIEPLPN